MASPGCSRGCSSAGRPRVFRRGASINLWAHVGFFLVLSLAIVILSAFYSEVDDSPALRSVPKRYVVFIGACALVAGAMLVLERLFASVG